MTWIRKKGLLHDLTPLHKHRLRKCCGKTPTFVWFPADLSGSHEFWRIVCVKCQASTKGRSRKEAIELWESTKKERQSVIGGNQMKKWDVTLQLVLIGHMEVEAETEEEAMEIAADEYDSIGTQIECDQEGEPKIISAEEIDE